MKIYKLLLGACLIMTSFASHAAEQFVLAKVSMVEICDVSPGFIAVFLKNASGAVPSSGDGCSNYGSYPFVRIANSATEFDSKKSLLSMALTAQSTGAQIRIRYDDSNSNKVISLAIVTN